ncbi:MAG: replicative DNA helicase, partial [Clostridiales bacterium]|nr:replicative DNA helicase [Clostridiales bacterium]
MEEVIKRIQPHSVDAERSVIGSMLMDKDAILAASEILNGEEFYQQQYGVLFETMVELYNDGIPVDLVTLPEKLKEKSLPPELTSVEFIRDLLSAVPTSTNVKHYAEIVREKSVLRRLIKVTEGIANTCYQANEPVEEILAETEKQIFDVVQNRANGDFVSIKQVVIEAIESIERAAKTNGKVTGIPTGFYDLDYKTAGFHPSDLILVAARPAMGKTAFVLNIAEHVALREKISTAIFSLEMSKEQLVKRILSMNSKVDSQSMRTGELQDDDWLKLVESGKRIGGSGLIIDDTPGISISELRSKCRKYKIEHNLGMVIIDYL